MEVKEEDEEEEEEEKEEEELEEEEEIFKKYVRGEEYVGSIQKIVVRIFEEIAKNTNVYAYTSTCTYTYTYIYEASGCVVGRRGFSQVSLSVSLSVCPLTWNEIPSIGMLVRFTNLEIILVFDGLDALGLLKLMKI